jgi:demethoxyubiquinone hydroxylase (CLK1/Coq7/Cat5 family)
MNTTNIVNESVRNDNEFKKFRLFRLKHTDTAHKSTAKPTRYAAIKRKLKAALCRSKYIIDTERSDAAPV